MRAYVINLARSPDRRAHMIAELEKSGIDYEIVTAVDERDVDVHDRRLVHPSYLRRDDYCLGRAGNGLSHLRIYQKVLADGAGQALVLEDDVALSGELRKVLDAVGEHLAGAEVVLLNFDSEKPCELSKEVLARLPHSRSLAFPIDIRQPVSAAAYVITHEACKRLSENALPIRAHSDDWYYWYNEGAIDRLRCVAPLTVFKDPSFESTIQYHTPTSFKALLLRLITSRKVPLAHQLISRRRERIWHKWTRVAFVDKPFIAKPSRFD